MKDLFKHDQRTDDIILKASLSHHNGNEREITQEVKEIIDVDDDFITRREYQLKKFMIMNQYIHILLINMKWRWK